MSAPILNPRLAEVKESATLAINIKAKAMRAAGRDIAHFGFGESPFSVHPKLQNELAKNAHRKSYLPGMGLPQLRENIATYYRARGGYNFSADTIAVGPGSKELIFHLLYILDGDLVLPAPSWVSYAPQAALHGKPVHFIRTRREDGYKLRAAMLEKKLQTISSPQKILILNSPCNPSGQVYGEKELESLAAIFAKYNVVVISDEIYAQTDFCAPLSPSIAAVCPQRTIVTAGLSKAFAAGGWRLGFAAAADSSLSPVFCALAALISETFSCVCAPVQYAAVVAYSGDSEIEKYIRDCARTHAAVVNETARRLRAAGVFCDDGKGGFYLFPNFNDFAKMFLSRGIKTATQLADSLLQECAIAALPGEDFGLPKKELALRVAPMDYDGDALLQLAVKHGDNFNNEIATRAEERIPKITAACERLTKWLHS